MLIAISGSSNSATSAQAMAGAPTVPLRTGFSALSNTLQNCPGRLSSARGKTSLIQSVGNSDTIRSLVRRLPVAHSLSTKPLAWACLAI